MRFSEHLIITKDLSNLPPYAQLVDPSKVQSCYSLLCQYCANYDIDLTSVTSKDFIEGVTLLEQAKYDNEPNIIAFWIEEF